MNKVDSKLSSLPKAYPNYKSFQRKRPQVDELSYEYSRFLSTPIVEPFVPISSKVMFRLSREILCIDLNCLISSLEVIAEKLQFNEGHTSKLKEFFLNQPSLSGFNGFLTRLSEIPTVKDVIQFLDEQQGKQEETLWQFSEELGMDLYN
ncbi:MAG: hypothetical protein QNJ31_01060 [Candidatus Caenarcaniphilales bacterium]|nr:hypothetical protein [Candidatus Caenarcaniphilales bacterium]